MQTIDEILSEKKLALVELCPASAKSLKALVDWYDVELTYSSNAIEGNSLTRGETAILLEKGITVGGKTLKDHLEAVGHFEALAYVRNLAGQERPILENDVRQIHALVLGRTEPDEAGRYSGHQRHISGSTLILPSPAEILPLMGDFGRWLAAEIPSAETAFTAHERLVTIHPFSDGNGRTARLLMNLVLLRADYPPVVIEPEQRGTYLYALQTLQVQADPAPYRDFMLERLDVSLSHHIDTLRRGLDRSAPLAARAKNKP